MTHQTTIDAIYATARAMHAIEKLNFGTAKALARNMPLPMDTTTDLCMNGPPNTAAGAGADSPGNLPPSPTKEAD